MFIPAPTRNPLKGKAAFDFNKAVAEARRDYPRETKNTTFVDLDAPDAMEQMASWVEKLDEASIKVLYRTGTLMEMNPDSDGFSISSLYGDKRIVATHSQHNPFLPFFAGEPDKQAAFVFFHELGHVVVPGADIPTNYSEQSADVFGVLRGISKGLFEKKDVKRLADERLVSYFKGLDIQHLSTMALDAVVINPKHIDFVSLTPKQVARVATEHAEAFASHVDTEMKIVDATLNGWSAQHMFDNFADIALKSSGFTHEFYIAARMLKPLLDSRIPDEVVAEMTGMPPEKWGKVKEALARKTGKRDIGAVKAMETPGFAPPPEGLGRRILNALKPLSI